MFEFCFLDGTECDAQFGMNNFHILLINVLVVTKSLGKLNYIHSIVVRITAVQKHIMHVLEHNRFHSAIITGHRF